MRGIENEKFIFFETLLLLRKKNFDRRDKL